MMECISLTSEGRIAFRLTTVITHGFPIQQEIMLLENNIPRSSLPLSVLFILATYSCFNLVRFSNTLTGRYLMSLKDKYLRSKGSNFRLVFSSPKDPENKPLKRLSENELLG